MYTVLSDYMLIATFCHFSHIFLWNFFLTRFNNRPPVLSPASCIMRLNISHWLGHVCPLCVLCIALDTIYYICAYYFWCRFYIFKVQVILCNIITNLIHSICVRNLHSDNAFIILYDLSTCLWTRSQLWYYVNGAILVTSWVSIWILPESIVLLSTFKISFVCWLT